jgi:4-amino-4-deoxy-L-arabinose transferase-like glycosyltransferase
MSTRRSLGLVCLIAFLHAIFFIWYQRPDWYTQWSDQEGYRRLGQVLAEHGMFTRFPDAPRFVPEVIRTPVYPLFVALIYRLFGVHQIAVALAQSIVFVAIVRVAFELARLATGSDRLALVTAAAVATFPPIPYFAALVMTEAWTTMLFTVSMWMACRAMREPTTGRFVALGIVLAITTLSRPVFVLFPFALAAIWAVVFPWLRVRPRPRAADCAVMLAAFAITMTPWFSYNYVTLGRFTLSPAGGIGRGLWEGSWQARWSGRVQNELTHIADETPDRATLDERVRTVAARKREAAGPMLDYVHQWQDIRRIWDGPADPYTRAVARVTADQEYGRVAVENLRRQPRSRLVKRLARGVFVLWAGEIPVRYSAINALPPMAIYACWAVQAAILGAALAGVVLLVRTGRVDIGCVLAAPIVYITAVHFPLLTEARQSLPAQPIVLLLATIAVMSPRGHSLPREPQVHEREHL